MTLVTLLSTFHNVKEKVFSINTEYYFFLYLSMWENPSLSSPSDTLAGTNQKNSAPLSSRGRVNRLKHKFLLN